jgi:hypothetical protein
MLCTTNYNNKSKNLLARGRILNFLNNSLQEPFLMPTIIYQIFSLMGGLSAIP